jgi:predicted hotdog family 3-hydroxylacyl-ACP dehydratase
MIKRTLDLETLLPHRAPMLLLSEVVDYDDTFASALVHITADSPFFDAELGGVPGWVGMEYMAQTIGIWAGYQKLINNKPVQAGFLLGCRSYDCNNAVFPEGCTLQLSAKPVYLDDSGIGAFDCVISAENIIASEDIRATAQIKAFRPQDPKDFVRPFSTYNSIATNTGTTA